MLDHPDNDARRFSISPMNSPWETAHTLFPGDLTVENAAQAIPDKPLTRSAHQTNVDWPRPVPGQADASDHLLQCDDPGIPRCSPQSISTLCPPVAQVKLTLAFRTDSELLFANSLRHAPSSLPRKSIPPPGKRQKWFPGSDNGARVVQGLHGSSRHPMDPTRSEHSQPDAFAPSANRDRHSTPEERGAPRDDCPSHPPNRASATDSRAKSGTSDATPRLMYVIDSLRTQKGHGQARMPFCNSGDPNEEEANLAPCAGLDSVLFLMTSVLGGFFEWKRRQPCPEAGRFQHAISSCV